MSTAARPRGLPKLLSVGWSQPQHTLKLSGFPAVDGSCRLTQARGPCLLSVRSTSPRYLITVHMWPVCHCSVLWQCISCFRLLQCGVSGLPLQHINLLLSQTLSQEAGHLGRRTGSPGTRWRRGKQEVCLPWTLVYGQAWIVCYILSAIVVAAADGIEPYDVPYDR